MILAQQKEFQSGHVEQRKVDTSRRRQRRLNPVAVLTLICIITVAISLGSVLQKTAIVTAGYQLQELQAKLEEVKEENARLQIAVARLKSLDRIEHIARHELGMVKPEKVEFLVLDDPAGKVVESGTVVAANSSQGWTGRVLQMMSEIAQQLLPGTDTAEAGAINR